MDKNKLRGLIYSNYRTVADMARKMGWGKQKLWRIITGKQLPNAYEIDAMAKAMQASRYDILDLFLAP